MTYRTETQIIHLNPDQPDVKLIEQAAEILRAGGLVAFPTETVYGLGANAYDAAAVERIFSAKGRPASDPIIVHIHSLSQLDKIATLIPPITFQLAGVFWPGPLTLVLERSARIPPNVSAGMPTVAVRMPNHPITLALLCAADVPIAAPSANRFARPSATTAMHVLEDLGGQVDVILDGGPATIGVESTILDLTKTPPVVLRPGGVALEKLRVYLPDVAVIARHLHPDEAGIEAPGMLVKHYSPRAAVLLFVGDLAQVIPAMQARARELIAAGQRVGVLTPDSEVGHFDGLNVRIILLGDTLESASHRLFAGMRALDQQAVDAILVHSYEPIGLGAALADRLLRAAEGRVIRP
jgi:L-threonylcarbamoyladenylate synthase